MTDKFLKDGEYQLGSAVGRGAVATVYRAFSRSRQEDVAVKVLSPVYADEPWFRKAFLHEGSLLAGLHHPHLLEVYDCAEEGGLTYISMRLAGLGTAKQWLAFRAWSADPAWVARCLSGVAAALDCIHEQGCLHLDVKPGNILMGEGGWPWLADFGIAQAPFEPLPQAGSPSGTPAYMAPEVVLGGAPAPAADQYSLAAAAYELLTGERPSPARSLAERVTELRDAPSSLDLAAAQPTLRPILARALAADPEARFSRAGELATAFSGAAEDLRRFDRHSRWQLIGIAPLATVVAALLIAQPFAQAIPGIVIRLDAGALAAFAVVAGREIRQGTGRSVSSDTATRPQKTFGRAVWALLAIQLAVVPLLRFSQSEGLVTANAAREGLWLMLAIMIAAAGAGGWLVLPLAGRWARALAELLVVHDTLPGGVPPSPRTANRVELIRALVLMGIGLGVVLLAGMLALDAPRDAIVSPAGDLLAAIVLSAASLLCVVLVVALCSARLRAWRMALGWLIERWLFGVILPERQDLLVERQFSLGAYALDLIELLAGCTASLLIPATLTHLVGGSGNPAGSVGLACALILLAERARRMYVGA